MKIVPALLQILIVLLSILLTNCNDKRQNNIETIGKESMKTIHTAPATVKEEVVLTKESKPLDSIKKVNCLHTNLSEAFNFEITIETKKLSDRKYDSYILKIVPITKSAERLQAIYINADSYYDEDFSSCQHVRSYSTDFNNTMEVQDHDYGDFVVADYNFDLKDDFAIKRDPGFNTGPEYDYFLQTEDTDFVKNKFLSNSVVYFPDKIDAEKHQLVSWLHAGACHLGKHVYQFNSKTETWKELSHELTNICEKN